MLNGFPWSTLDKVVAILVLLFNDCWYPRSAVFPFVQSLEALTCYITSLATCYISSGTFSPYRNGLEWPNLKCYFSVVSVN